jgi:hypothetical protein
MSFPLLGGFSPFSQPFATQNLYNHTWYKWLYRNAIGTTWEKGGKRSERGRNDYPLTDPLFRSGSRAGVSAPPSPSATPARYGAQRRSVLSLNGSGTAQVNKSVSSTTKFSKGLTSQ